MGSPIKLGTAGIVCLMLSFSCSPLFAQTWGEWLRQKSTQKKYLYTQIAALQLYAGYLKKGYEIAGDGLSIVHSFKNGEFGLHQLYFASLKAVNPAIRNSPGASEILENAARIQSLFAGIGGLQLPDDHKAYIKTVRDNLLRECGDDLEELEIVITPGKAEMTDDERLGRLEKLTVAMQDKLDFSRHFSQQVKMLVQQRKTETNSIDHLKQYYETDK
ncbi:hypothetical protein SAMN05216464_108117 [Mucilaginibacter pineti]|uniref:TerB family tellurite resistance protein n=1 Tax=Mucilaginibacter pineti TaxID=1391627 RepID=A0A1G7EQ38_9SPHI|nr:hypothetical protein [Mucilaginibacter pineti]SDE65774.1 hypothetical protein SAMN05216464_108117 [Mucilaginibacter pineti]